MSRATCISREGRIKTKRHIVVRQKMEEILREIDQERVVKPHAPQNADKIAAALRALATALVHAQPLLLAAGASLPENTATPVASATDASPDGVVSAYWLMSVLSEIPSELGTQYMAEQVLETSRSTTDPAAQQDALFNILGFSEQAMAALETILPRVAEIAVTIKPSDLDSSTSAAAAANRMETATTVDIEAERRHFLVQEARELAEVASIARAEADALTGGGGGSGTHSVAFASHKHVIKQADKAQKRAEQALQRAKDAGAIVDGDDLLQVDTSVQYGQGGLLGRSHDELAAIQQALLPAGSRHYYDHRGLPTGTIHETEDDYEKVIIPPLKKDDTEMHPRLNIADILNSEEQKAFAGTTSLNPMQSTVFDVAFHHRDNMLVCAPTSAGKTNVAMLTVVAHFRDVGLIGGNGSYENSMETGDKVIYVAPMKALAQEVVEKFSSKLKALKLIVRELTGDMQLTRAEAESANVIVTTPEKWDVVTRKSGNDENSLGNKCGLLIIDEVHLLADERGAVIESVVARLHRLVESRQKQTRIVGLSATLPNYEDVAEFLQVPSRGTFFFGPEHRPVSLVQNFIGIQSRTKDRRAKEHRMNEICFDVVLDSLRRGYQVMVFVHSRKGTGDTASALADIASQEGVLDRNFVTQGKENAGGEAYKRYVDRVRKSRNREVGVHFDNGMGIHHAGMLRGDRKLTEQMFSDGAIKVLCCTATLAWGINLPAHTVVIKGTDIYNAEKGGVVDLSILDVQQIFGRAGRPQFDTSGEATMITSAEAFPKYMDKLVRAMPIESNFIKQLADHLNAEVVGGTVTSIKEGARWLTYTYLYTRMLRNPLAYGINADEKQDDPMLSRRCTKLITEAAQLLVGNEMIRYNVNTGNLSVAQKGKVAAHFYVQAESIETFNEMMRDREQYTDGFLIKLVCSATEFRGMKVRQEELSELATLHARECPIKLDGAGLDDQGMSLITGPEDKAFILTQCYISRSKIRGFTLISDMNYVASNCGRIARSLFELCLGGGKASAALKLLRLAKSVDNQFWWFQSPLRHFHDELKEQQLSAIEMHGNDKRYDGLQAALALLDLQAAEVGHICKMAKAGKKVQQLVRMIPNVDVTCKVQPVTSEVFNFHITLVGAFNWLRRWHGGAQSFWLWVEDGSSNRLYHHENIVLSHRTFSEEFTLDLSIPVFGRVPSQYLIRVVSDSWVGVEYVHPVLMDNVVVPGGKRPETDLQDLTPLPTTALQDERYQALYAKIDTFNPIQTQLFHVLYHTDLPVFLGAPTGSGKTIVAELAILRMKRLHPKSICVYIAPLKSLAKERLKEWRSRLGGGPLRWNVLELSGDTSHDRSTMEKADILVCTPEKWDLITRGWKGSHGIENTNAANGKAFVKRVRLLVMDEVHLVGEDRGAVLEAIVSRTRYISRLLQEKPGSIDSTGQEITRLIGLSTSLENAQDVADWLGVDTKSHSVKSGVGMYNFRSSVRPVPTRVHVQGYTGRHYCPRMATMNKPCYAAIKDYSSDRPALIFVASRRQTRLTAIDIISHAAADETPKRFLDCPDEYIESIATDIQDEALRHTIIFGIGLHHAGLSAKDRDVVERLYLKGDIKVLVATATLAWGVNLPARLVIVKGTEFFDGKVSRYVDYPLTDVLQMIGRAGRPGFDDQGEAVVMTTEDKKTFYRKFLYKPFPLESKLDERMSENINAEIAGGTIASITEAVGYLSWTFYARRCKGNPSFYGLESGSDEHVAEHFIKTTESTIERLKAQRCVKQNDEDLTPTTLGLAACNYYLDHRTPKQMQFGIREARKVIHDLVEKQDSEMSSSNEKQSQGLVPLENRGNVEEMACAWLLYTLCSTHEMDELPVRHNEEQLNEELSYELMWGADTQSLMAGGKEVYHDVEVFLDPHTKAFLLVQAYLERVPLPISDYVNDTKSVTENLPRLLAAMEFIASDDIAAGSFDLMTEFTRTRQVWASRTLPDEDPLEQMSLSENTIDRIKSGGKPGKDLLRTILDLRRAPKNRVRGLLQRLQKTQKNGSNDLQYSIDLLHSMPLISLKEVLVSSDVDKANGKTIGKLKLDLEVQREPKPSRKNDYSPAEFSLSILVGTFQQSILLSHSSVRITRSGTWSISKELSFDWQAANAGGGENGGKIRVRFLLNEVRGLDFELLTNLK
mmetsp:Transcript_20166/g.43517  ORF Transcript_20166/g.43517 Transcript_20166/m.43517 type:complete len:2151 (-) Transcript_20166:75-6527(-)